MQGFKSVLLWSGGIVSTTLLHFLRDQGIEPQVVHFGSDDRVKELAKALDVDVTIRTPIRNSLLHYVSIVVDECVAELNQPFVIYVGASMLSWSKKIELSPQAITMMNALLQQVYALAWQPVVAPFLLLAEDVVLATADQYVDFEKALVCRNGFCKRCEECSRFVDEITKVAFAYECKHCDKKVISINQRNVCPQCGEPLSLLNNVDQAMKRKVLVEGEHVYSGGNVWLL